MLASDISALTSCMSPFVRKKEGDITDVEMAVIDFSHLYSNPAFGWFCATWYADMRLQFPVAMKGRSSWVFRAYMHRLDSRYRDRHIAEASALNDPSMSTSKQVLRSLLISSDANLSNISKYTGLHLRTVEAYEQLFFNVVDRRNDALYIRNIVYPEGRIEEMMPDYIENAGIEDLLMRAGYNSGAEHAAYMAGLGDNTYLQDLATLDNAERLQNTFMANGAILVRNGWINQNPAGLHRSTRLMAAALQGGQQEVVNPMADVGDAIDSQLSELVEREHALRYSIAKKRSTVLDAEVIGD